MGYTHEYVLPLDQSAPTGAYGRLLVDAKAIVEHVTGLGIELVAPSGHEGTVPQLTEGLIGFNGLADEGHTGFWWPSDMRRELQAQLELATSTGNSQAADYARGKLERDGPQYCKTERKPYDVAVCAVLIRARVHYGDTIAIHSNGGWDDEWRNGALGGGYCDAYADRKWPGLSARGVCETLFGEAVNPLNDDA